MAKTTQDKPTAPRPTSKEGRALDGFGLPLSGPARLAELERRGRRDPNHHPEDWVAPAPDEGRTTPKRTPPPSTIPADES